MKNLRLAAAFAPLCLTRSLLSAAPETFKIDPVHSSAIFKIGHNNVGNIYGDFSGISGSLTQDMEAPENGKIDVTIDVNTLDTNNEKRDEHVKGPDYLSAKQFPTMNFSSDSVKKLSDKEFEAIGKFTMHGVTKPLTVKFTKIGEIEDPKGGTRIGGESTFTVKRSDYDVAASNAGLSDEVTITIAVEALHKDEQ